jgi:hypothetical protein
LNPYRGDRVIEHACEPLQTVGVGDAVEDFTALGPYRRVTVPQSGDDRRL